MKIKDLKKLDIEIGNCIITGKPILIGDFVGFVTYYGLQMGVIIDRFKYIPSFNKIYNLSPLEVFYISYFCSRKELILINSLQDLKIQEDKDSYVLFVPKLSKPKFIMSRTYIEVINELKKIRQIK